jgi:phage terminase large subunit GpA-like protein
MRRYDVRCKHCGQFMNNEHRCKYQNKHTNKPSFVLFRKLQSYLRKTKTSDKYDTKLQSYIKDRIKHLTQLSSSIKSRSKDAFQLKELYKHRIDELRLIQKQLNKRF